MLIGSFLILFQLYEEGSLHELKQTWLKVNEPSSCDLAADQSSITADFIQLKSLFVIWASGIVASLVVVLCEIALNRGSNSPGKMDS